MTPHDIFFNSQPNNTKLNALGTPCIRTQVNIPKGFKNIVELKSKNHTKQFQELNGI